MSVITQIVVESRRYSGWIDPRYPIGYWQAALTIVGDATGGVVGLDLVFQGASPPTLNSQMYSVERLGLTQGNSGNRQIRISAINMAGPANQGFLHEYTFLMLGQDTGLNKSAIRADMLSILPWFLGSQRTRGITASLSAVLPNVDGIGFTFEAEGYRWGARSVLVDGGPQRPPTGPYRT